MVNHTYLDYGASSPVGEDVINTMVDVAKNCYGNPSSKHNDGVEAHDIIAHARKTIMDYIGGNEGDDLIFTSGATESNSIAIQGFCRAYNKVRIFYTPLEHEDIIQAVKYCTEHMSGVSSCEIPVEEGTGYIDIDGFDNLLFNARLKHPGEVFLIIIQLANSEIGTIQLSEILYDVIREYDDDDICIMSDITQYLPYYRFKAFNPDMRMCIDIVTASAQKFGGLKGTGFLYVNSGWDIDPVIFGEQGVRGGTENVIGIAAMETAIKHLDKTMEVKQKKLLFIYNYLKKKLSKIEGVEIIGDPFNRLINNLSFVCNTCDLSAQQIVELCNESGVSISAGSACHNYSSEPSRTLLAIGLSPEKANKVIRVTWGEYTTIDDICTFLDVYKEILAIHSNK